MSEQSKTIEAKKPSAFEELKSKYDYAITKLDSITILLKKKAEELGGPADLDIEPMSDVDYEYESTSVIRTFQDRLEAIGKITDRLENVLSKLNATI